MNARRKENHMPNEKPAGGARKTIGDIAPKLAEITDDVLFGDIWERPQLSKRDRSLITCAALVATVMTNRISILALCTLRGAPERTRL
jgi:4-carboxymuconolactone decarboxylase